MYYTANADIKVINSMWSCSRRTAFVPLRTPSIRRSMLHFRKKWPCQIWRRVCHMQRSTRKFHSTMILTMSVSSNGGFHAKYCTGFKLQPYTPWQILNHFLRSFIVSFGDIVRTWATKPLNFSNACHLPPPHTNRGVDIRKFRHAPRNYVQLFRVSKAERAIQKNSLAPMASRSHRYSNL